MRRYAQNASTIVEYRKVVFAGHPATTRGIALTAEDRPRGEVIERLMCDLAVDLDAICRRHQADPSCFAAEIEKVVRLAEDRLAVRSGMRIEVPEAARLLIRVLCATFDTRLAGTEGRHAPTA